ncbi:hypothetical protein BDW62DRAFT_184164 [Aspergillus aurantiobrunneus]
MASEVWKDELDAKNQNGSVDQVAAADDSQASDNDGGERPVRNKLKETTITSVPKTSTDASTAPRGDSSRASSRGRKRSLDDGEAGDNDDELGHRRKRSRDSSREEATDEVQDQDQPRQSQDSGSTLKKKRSRDQLDKNESKVEEKGEKVDAKGTAKGGAAAAKAAVEGEPEKKRHRDGSQERDPAPLPNAFANTSSVSPFGAIGSSTSKQPAEEAKPATSSSAFASSTLAAFAGSEQSPFGSLGASTPSVFKSSAESTPAETDKPAATGFAAAAKPSGFAALGSGFSGFSGGFGAAGSSGGLTSFAAPGGPSVLGGASSKPFGAEADSDEEDEKEDEADSGPGEFEADKTDERFYARQIETGEEEEKTYFACKAKLFHFSDMEWRERGLGNFKVNVKVTDGVEDKKSARMVMRADGVLRVMLNTALFKGMNVGDASGNEPRSKQIHLASLEGNRSVPLLLRTGSEDQAKELYHTLQDLLKHL